MPLLTAITVLAGIFDIISQTHARIEEHLTNAQAKQVASVQYIV